MKRASGNSPWQRVSKEQSFHLKSSGGGKMCCSALVHPEHKTVAENVITFKS